MEHTASCRVRAERLHSLTDAYRCFLAGSCPRRSAASAAELILSAVRGAVPGEGGECCRELGVELSCCSLTLVQQMSCRPAQAPAYWTQVLTLLFEHMDLMSVLVHHFNHEEQVVCHLAAKTVSTNVVYHLHKCGAVSPIWQQKCVEAFHSSVSGPELDSCLWSLTDVLKQLLKEAHQEILRNLLAAFDSSLCTLCSKFLPEQRKEAAQGLVGFTQSRHRGTTFCLFLDLLEALTASTLMCVTDLKSQRLTYIHSSALLTTVSCSTEYFVKKRVLLLLKRVVLQKAGEDWALGDGLSTGLRYQHLSSDSNMLAQTVLTAVADNWLQSLQVESASFFGGTRRLRADEGQKADCVMLRAVSLLLLKSMELYTQTAQAAEVDCAREVTRCLQNLWSFLRRCSPQLREVIHLCSWISLLFGEQDDDMMEAAKALLSIFFHHRVSFGLDDFTVLEAACRSGCNPHCHFLLLLQSICFNHSILLDFLISTETCFLEYLVRYLKYLRADWQGFTAACERISRSDCHLSLMESPTGSCSGDTSAPTFKGEPDLLNSGCLVQPPAVNPPAERMGLVSGLRLVEYNESDESDSESMEISEDEPGTSAGERSRCRSINMKQETNGPPVFTRHSHHESSDSAGLQSESNCSMEQRPVSISESKLTSCTKMAAESDQDPCETLSRAVLCLSELRQVVTRLQAKKLFPYNPSSLLKLLAQVQNCPQQSHLS